jgi:phage protein D
MVIDAPVASVEEARRLAASLLRERAYEFITATGRVAGLPELRPGDNVEIFGVGARFSGSYFVRKVEHSLGGSGFFTEFAARRVWSGER